MIDRRKLAALEAGDVSNTYCRELDQLCRLYQEENPPGLFIGGYALIHLWRRNPFEFLYPLKVAEMPLAPDPYSSDSRQFYPIMNRDTPMAVISSGADVVFKNRSMDKAKSFIREIEGDIRICPHGFNMVLWLNGRQLTLSKPAFSQGTAYLYSLNHHDSHYNLTMVALELEGQSLDPDEIGNQIRQILMG